MVQKYVILKCPPGLIHDKDVVTHISYYLNQLLKHMYNVVVVVGVVCVVWLRNYSKLFSSIKKYMKCIVIFIIINGNVIFRRYNFAKWYRNRTGQLIRNAKLYKSNGQSNNNIMSSVQKKMSIPFSDFLHFLVIHKNTNILYVSSTKEFYSKSYHKPNE